MEASDGVVRGTVDSLTKLLAALDIAGIELIGENAISHGGGRGVRLKETVLRDRQWDKSRGLIPVPAAGRAARCK
jgi:hypothetical protein